MAFLVVPGVSGLTNLFYPLNALVIGISFVFLSYYGVGS
jgi:hypothetical protein